jgi:glycosyltransferase involved in cell wall biosynthesis
MASQSSVSVLVLTLNEGKNIGGLIAAIDRELTSLGMSHEAIVVDGGSTDETVRAATEAGAKVITQKMRGYGNALREGFELCRGEWVLTLDADWSHPPSLIGQLFNERGDADLVVASRAVAHADSKAPAYRRFLSWVLNGVYRAILTVPVGDLSSGFRLYRRSSIRPELTRSTNFDVLPELLIRTYTDGFKVKEFPLQFQPRAAGVSHAHPIKFAMGYLRTLSRLWVIRNLTSAADYDYRAYRSRIPLQRYWQWRRAKLLDSFLDAKLPTADIGCGSSYRTASDPGAVALDISAAKLRFLKSFSARRVRGHMLELPIRDAAFSQAVCSQALDHTPHPESVLRELNRILSLQGTLVVGVPDYSHPWWPLLEFGYAKVLPNTYADVRFTHFTAASLREMLTVHGFEVLEMRWILRAELIVKARKIAASAGN